jgi:hypothetical protein
MDDRLAKRWWFVSAERERQCVCVSLRTAQRPAEGSRVQPISVRPSDVDIVDRLRMSLPSSGPASFTTNVALGRSLAHRGSLQLLAHPPSVQGAFSLFLQAAQTFSLAVRQASGASDKADVQRELKAALSKAEACKAVLKAKEPEGTLRRPLAQSPCAPGQQQRWRGRRSTPLHNQTTDPPHARLML